MDPPQLQDPRFGAWGHLVWAGVGLRTPVSQAGQALFGIAPQPGVHGLAAYPIAAGDVSDARPTVEDLQHRLIPLFHEPQLHQHGHDLPL